MPRVYESRTNRALVHNYFIARKYCVLSRYVANNNINVFPANTFFNDAYQTISDIQFIATGRVAPVTGYKYILLYGGIRTYVSNTHAHVRMSVCYYIGMFLDRTDFTVSLL